MKRELATKNVRITPSVYQLLCEIALREGRSLAGTIQVTVHQYAKRKKV